MTARAILSEAARVGVRLTASDHGTLKYSGAPSALERLLPEIRAHKSELVALLHQDSPQSPESQGVTQENEISPFYASAERLADDRVTCSACARLEPDGRCQAARRAEMIHCAAWFTPEREEPRRCPAYRPHHDAEDQRTGRERFPGLARRLLREGTA